jgi:hypothetical protein
VLTTSALSAYLKSGIPDSKPFGGTRTLVNLGTLCTPFLNPRLEGLKVVYLSFAGISCSFGNVSARAYEYMSLLDGHD